MSSATAPLAKSEDDFHGRRQPKFHCQLPDAEFPICFKAGFAAGFETRFLVCFEAGFAAGFSKLDLTLVKAG